MHYALYRVSCQYVIERILRYSLVQNFTIKKIVFNSEFFNEIVFVLVLEHGEKGIQ